MRLYLHSAYTRTPNSPGISIEGIMKIIAAFIQPYEWESIDRDFIMSIQIRNHKFKKKSKIIPHMLFAYIQAIYRILECSQYVLKW